MKKLLLTLIALSSLAPLHAKTHMADKSIEFKKMSKEQKSEWFDFADKWNSKKIQMMKDHKQQWFDYGIENIDSWNQATIKNQDDKQTLFHEQLKKALEIRKQHGQEWKEYYDSFQEEGGKIYQKHVEAIQSFEKSLELAKDQAPGTENDDDDNDDD